MLVKKNTIFENITLLFVFIILFFPTKYFALYYGLISLLTLSVFTISKFKCLKTIYFNLFFILTCLIVISSSLSSIYLNSDFFRNITEVVRFIPVILIFANYKNYAISYFQLFSIFSIYTIIGSFINVFQFLGVKFINGISELYNDPLHIENSLGIANRSLGMSGGPGPNGVIFAILFVFFFTSLLSGRFKFLSIILMLFSLVSIFCSQSQTAFVALSLAILFILGLWSISNYKRKSFYYIFCLVFFILITGLYYLLKNIQNFKYLNTLFEYGLNRSSYQSREFKFDETIKILDNFFFSMIGYGKDYIPGSSALDNEYLFIFSVYGFIGFSIVILFYYYNTVYLYFKGAENIYKYLIVFTCFMGLIVSWPSSFLLDPRVLFVLIIYIVCYLRECRSE